MIDPNLAVQIALFTKLNSSNITLNNVVVPVLAYVPQNTPAPYVLLDQISTVGGVGSANCIEFDCIYQLSVITSFINIGDDLPSLTIQSELVELLHNKRLTLGDGFECSPLDASRTRKLVSYNDKLVYVMRYIELRMKVYK